MFRPIIWLLTTILLLTTACGGIPIRSLPRLFSLQQQLLDADPGQFMLAVQVDTRLVPPQDAAPTLNLTIRPDDAKTFEPIDKKLPMQFTVADTNGFGLSLPNKARKWLLYRLTADSQQQLRDLQNHFKGLRGQKLGGTLSVGIAQEGIAVRDSQFADTRWESWLRTSEREGFFELWSGTVAELLQLAEQAKSR